MREFDHQIEEAMKERPVVPIDVVASVHSKDKMRVEHDVHHVLDDAAPVDTTGIGILDGTAQVQVTLPGTHDDLDDDDLNVYVICTYFPVVGKVPQISQGKIMRLRGKSPTGRFHVSTRRQSCTTRRFCCATPRWARRASTRTAT